MTITDPESYLQLLPSNVLLRAKLISSHMILPDGAKVYDIGCNTGELTAALAALNPYLKFIGVERKESIANIADNQFKFRNLSFISGDITQDDVVDDEVADAILNSRILGEIYTRTGYNAEKVQTAMENQFRILKKGGLYILYDYVAESEDEYVLIEFPVMKGSGFKTRAQMRGGKDKDYQGERDCETLKWFSENARASASQHQSFRGFFLEELPAQRPFTRLFRLPHKWAYEFMLRMDNFDITKKDAAVEFTCLTVDDYVRVMERNCGRITYSRPWRNPNTLRDVYKKRFRLYHDDEDLTPMAFPATGFMMIAQKEEEGRSLRIKERRPSSQEASSMIVTTMKDETTGNLIDIAAKTDHTITLIPFVHDHENNRVQIAMKRGAGTILSNTVLRSGHNIDRRRWSGHGYVTLELSPDQIDENERVFMRETFGMKTAVNSEYLLGPKGFPSPDKIENYVETFYIELSKDQEAFEGNCVLIDAEQILRAINAGYIPDAWLEVQVEALLKHCGIMREPWMHEELPIGTAVPPDDMILDVDKIFNFKPEDEDKDKDEKGEKEEGKKGEDEGRYRPVKGKAGQLKAKRSVFIGEGQQSGSTSGIVSSEHDFIVPQDGIINRAAVLTLTSDLKGETLVGFQYEEMPAPYRMGMKDKMINLPVIDLPKNMSNIDEVKEFLAQKFETTPDRVAQMGESFFTMRDMMPERTYLFAVASEPCVWMGELQMFHAPIKDLINLEPDFKWSMLYTYALQYAIHGGCAKDASINYEPRVARHNQKFGALRSASSRGAGEGRLSTAKQAGWFAKAKQNDNRAVPVAKEVVSQPRRHIN